MTDVEKLRDAALRLLNGLYDVDGERCVNRNDEQALRDALEAAAPVAKTSCLTDDDIRRLLQKAHEEGVNCVHCRRDDFTHVERPDWSKLR